MKSTKVESRDSQIDLPLCPFDIGKRHNSTTNHWKEIIYMNFPVHVYCKKEDPSDTCSITIFGNECRKNQNCGRQLFKIMSG